MKARESGMPEEAYWESFFDADATMEILFNKSELAGHLVEFGCGYGTFTLAAARRTHGVVTALDIEPLIFNLLHLEQPVMLLPEVHRVLRNGGMLFVIHWRSNIPTPRGPSLAIRPRPEQCQAWLEEAGFRNVESVNLQPCCPYHFGLITRR